jgi:hypothetical protein
MSVVIGSCSNGFAADEPERAQAGKTTDLGPNPSGRTQGAPELRASVPGEYDHEGGHPERIRRRKEFASCDR